MTHRVARWAELARNVTGGQEIGRVIAGQGVLGAWHQESGMIEAIHSDFCTIRRELIMGKYMERERGKYRLTARGRAALAE